MADRRGGPARQRSEAGVTTARMVHAELPHHHLGAREMEKQALRRWQFPLVAVQRTSAVGDRQAVSWGPARGPLWPVNEHWSSATPRCLGWCLI
jgi:hypothetical protein